MDMKNLIKTSVVAAALILSAQALYATTPEANPASETTGQYVNGSALTTKVKAAFLQTSGLDSNAISVETYKNVVILSGSVNSEAQSQLAQKTAEGVSGVKKVKNKLVVKPN